jgi:hypothetical protein
VGERKRRKKKQVRICSLTKSDSCQFLGSNGF